jgi:exopolysaccharide biosynthesis polyprenyl glycosylphosphotransferase
MVLRATLHLGCAGLRDISTRKLSRLQLFAVLILAVLYSSHRLYNDKRNLFDDTDFMGILYSSMICMVVFVIFIGMFLPDELMLIQLLGLALAISVMLTTAGRLVLNRIVYVARKSGYDIRKTIYFGKRDPDLIKKISNSDLGYKVIKVTHNKQALERLLPKAQIVFLRMESIDDEMLEMMIKNDHINWKIVSSILNLVIEPVAFDEFKDYPIINVSNRDTGRRYERVKRAIDVLVSGISIVILSPLFLITAALIKITMPGPVFFRQQRLGKSMKRFTVFKFRTMVVGADARKKKLRNEVKGLFKMKDDPRITPLGRFLRRTCIDELPQLFNIFMGDMSIVGPRPHLKSELEHFCGWRKARFLVKPGLTGLWQVNGRHELNFDKAVLYDIYYVKHMSFLLDVEIILKTIPAIVMNRGRF